MTACSGTDRLIDLYQAGLVDMPEVQRRAALDGIAGAHVDWADSKGLNQQERKALELSEERSKLGYGISTVKDHQGDEHEHRAA